MPNTRTRIDADKFPAQTPSMARQKISIRQQQFGFPDEDLKTSLHDEIFFWLKKNKLEISKQLLGWSESWDAKFIKMERTRFAEQVEQRKERLEIDLSREKLWPHSGDRDPLYQQDKKSRLNAMRNYLAVLKSWTGLGEPPPRQIEVSSRGERPIKRERYKTTDIIGYADIIFTIRVNCLKASGVAVDNSGNPMVESDPPKWWTYWNEPFKIALDAKTTIPSFGQTLRELNLPRIP